MAKPSDEKPEDQGEDKKGKGIEREENTKEEGRREVGKLYPVDWPKSKFDVEDPTHRSNPEYLNGYIKDFLDASLIHGSRDNVLWEDFGTEFEGWTADIFVTADKNAQKELRDYLRRWGVYVLRKKRVGIHNELAKVVEEEKPHDWTIDEVRDQLEHDDFFSKHSFKIPREERHRSRSISVRGSGEHLGSRGRPRDKERRQTSTTFQKMVDLGLTTNPYPPTRQGSRESLKSSDRLIDVSPAREEREKEDEVKEKEVKPDIKREPSKTALPPLKTIPLPPLSPIQTTTVQLPTRTHQPAVVTPDFPPQLPREYPDEEVPISKELTTLAKMYRQEDLYTGGDDYLDYKLDIWQNNCYKSGISPKYYHLAFETGLTGEAKEHFFREINNKPRSIDSMVGKMRLHFETEERCVTKQGQWHSISLDKLRMKPENAGKSLKECFDLLVKELRLLQSACGPDYSSDRVIRDRLFLACRSTPACALGSYKPSGTFQGLVADLQGALSTSEELGVPTGIFTGSGSDVERQPQGVG